MRLEYIHGDAIDVLSTYPAGCVDVIVTSPPYNIGLDYGSGISDNMSREDYLEWIMRIALRADRMLKDGGMFFINIGGTPKDQLLPMLVAAKIAGSGLFQLQNHFHWIKSISLDSATRGHFKPINSKRFVNDCHEDVFMFTRTGDVPINRLAIGVPYADKSNLKRGTRGKNGDRRCNGNNWFIPYGTVYQKKVHPAQFPVKLAEKCIKLHYSPEVVLDPFVGVGNSAVAAINCGVKHFIGIDLNKQYLDLCPIGGTTTHG